ncbi:MAG: glucose-1-phosphate adenylyltransferase subunit GlgD [Clostridia bacterium]|nr:glucose-1-phosphate adenylyltransferase subunit GlgD [Clostridia bacterium]
MQNNTMGLIFSENPEANLGILTNKRALAAVPVGGRYRIIDFVLSNMINSGIINIGIPTAARTQSLTDHLGTGRDWDLDRKGNGLFLIPLYDSDSASIGGVGNIFNSFGFLKRAKQEYVVVSDCNTVCNITYDEVMAFHQENDADITLIYTDVNELSDSDLKRHILLDVSDDGRVTDMQIYPTIQKSNHSYMHTFLIKKELLMELTGDCVSHGKISISKDILLENLSRLKVLGYKFTGYRKKIDSIQAYFQFNLDLLKKDVRDELFGTIDNNKIFTKVKDMVPTRYGRNSQVQNSFIADGCTIEGTVKNSIIFRGVTIAEGATVENAIIMQNSQILENCLVENAIFDKEVVLGKGKKLVGQETYPALVGKRVII